MATSNGYDKRGPLYFLMMHERGASHRLPFPFHDIPTRNYGPQPPPFVHTAPPATFLQPMTALSVQSAGLVAGIGGTPGGTTGPETHVLLMQTHPWTPPAPALPAMQLPDVFSWQPFPSGGAGNELVPSSTHAQPPFGLSQAVPASGPSVQGTALQHAVDAFAWALASWTPMSATAANTTKQNAFRISPSFSGLTPRNLNVVLPDRNFESRLIRRRLRVKRQRPQLLPFVQYAWPAARQPATAWSVQSSSAVLGIGSSDTGRT
jgi:hypothetical protein